MPQWGCGNHRAQEARLRKQMEKERKQRELEEKKQQEIWRDDDKKIQAKLNRKMENEIKKQQKLEKKKELQALYMEEEQSLKSNKESKSTSKKITQAEIVERLLQEKKKELEKEKKKKENLNLHEMEIHENLNHIQREEMNEYDEYISATGIDNIIAQLGNLSLDKSKNVKAAYKKYEEENLPLLKQEYKNLKLSQYKQMLWKQFKKSPENPMNQMDIKG